MLKIDKKPSGRDFKGAVRFAFEVLQRTQSSCICEQTRAAKKLAVRERQLHVFVPGVVPPKSEYEIFVDTKNELYFMAVTSLLEPEHAERLGMPSSTTHIWLIELTQPILEIVYKALVSIPVDKIEEYIEAKRTMFISEAVKLNVGSNA